MIDRTYNIVVVDDHKMFLDGLLSIISKETTYKVILTANNGKNIIKYLDINDGKGIDLIISDVTMPEVDGIVLNQYVKSKFPAIKTLMVSMLHDSKTIHTLTKDNVDGYVPKNADKQELLVAMNTILTGQKYFSESIKQVYMQAMFSRDEEDVVALTKREKEVLALIAREFTTQEIADKLFLSKHTIEGYRKNLIAKLDVRNLAGLTKYAIKLGLLDD